MGSRNNAWRQAPARCEGRATRILLNCCAIRRATIVRSMGETYERGLKPRFKQADGHPALTPADPKVYRHLVARVSEYAISALDVTGRVVSWTLGAERTEEYAACEIVGLHFGALY